MLAGVDIFARITPPLDLSCDVLHKGPHLALVVERTHDYMPALVPLRGRNARR
jgi:hypothetical protein